MFFRKHTYETFLRKSEALPNARSKELSLLFLSRKKIQKSLDKLNATEDWTSNPAVTASSSTKGNVITTVLEILVIVSDRLPIMDHVTRG